MFSITERQSFTAIRRLGSVGGHVCRASHARNQRTTLSITTVTTTFQTPRLLQVSHFLRKLNDHTYQHSRTMVMITQTKAPTHGSFDNAATKESIHQPIDPQQQQEQQLHPPSPPLQSGEALSVLVTNSCFQRIHYLIAQKKKKKTEKVVETHEQENDDDSYYLRVFVDAGGCSGFTYQFELDTETNLNRNDDVIFTEPVSSIGSAAPAVEAARVVIDRGSLKLLAGSKIDYVQEMIKSTFEVRDNPQSESACGCGSSFAMKNFTSNPAID